MLGELEPLWHNAHLLYILYFVVYVKRIDEEFFF